MSTLEGKKLVSALMHEDTFMAGVGSIKKELHTFHDGVNKEVSLEVDGQFLIVGVKAAIGSKTYTIAVPLTNIKQLVYA